MSGALDASKEKREASSKRIKASFNRAVQLGAPLVRIFPESSRARILPKVWMQVLKHLSHWRMKRPKKAHHCH